MRPLLVVLLAVAMAGCGADSPEPPNPWKVRVTEGRIEELRAGIAADAEARRAALEIANSYPEHRERAERVAAQALESIEWTMREIRAVQQQLDLDRGLLRDGTANALK